MNNKISTSFSSAFVVLLAVLSVSCSSESSSSSTEIELLQLRIEELEAELRDMSSSTIAESDESATPSSAQTAESVTTSTVPAVLSREALAALKDCEFEARILVDFSNEGELPESFPSSGPIYESLVADFLQLRESCRQAEKSLELDVLQFGLQSSFDELVEKISDFNLSLLPAVFLLEIGEQPDPLFLGDWEATQSFPGYLSGFLESYQSR